jgi:hypothetical protein
MDFRTGKLSKEDHRALDRALRAEAIQLLRRIDALKPGEGPAARGAGSDAAGDDAGAAAPPVDDAATDAPRRDARVG